MMAAPGRVRVVGHNMGASSAQDFTSAVRRDEFDWKVIRIFNFKLLKKLL